MDNALSIGHAGEHLVMYDLLKNNINAMLTPEGFGYDIVIDMGKIVKLQVKTTTHFRNMSSSHKVKHYVFNVRKCGKKSKRLYKIGDFDAFAFAVLNEGIVGYMPFTSEINKTLLFRSKKVDYTNCHYLTKKVPYIEDMTFDNMIKELFKE